MALDQSKPVHDDSADDAQTEAWHLRIGMFNALMRVEMLEYVLYGTVSAYVNLKCDAGVR